MRSSVLLGLLGATLHINAHPVAGHNSYKSNLRRRSVDLNAFRLKSTAKYISSKATEDAVKIARRDTYVDTATELVKTIAPGAEFRLVNDHYVGENGIAHVNFKQTAHGLDIDNADVNVNVSCLACHLLRMNLLTTESDCQGWNRILLLEQLLHWGGSC